MLEKIQWLLAGLLSLLSFYAHAQALVDSVSGYQAESGLVTRKEQEFARRWVDAVTSSPQQGTLLDKWLGAQLPFSFKYGGNTFASIRNRWQLEKHSEQSSSTAQAQELVWTDASTGLKLTWQLKSFADYPAVEWVLWFENTGTKDTPIIEDIQALDLTIRRSGGNQPFMVHGANGGRSLRDDFMPFSLQVPYVYIGQESSYTYDKIRDHPDEITLGGAFPSSNRHLPFFNIETPDERGVMVGVGWSGKWLANMKFDGKDGLQTRVGMQTTHFMLHPGEKARSPRILLLFWEGKRLHGHNMLRQLLWKDYLPKLRGEAYDPLVSFNLGMSGAGGPGGINSLESMNEAKLLTMLKFITKIGVELINIDAGWWTGPDPNIAFDFSNWSGNWELDRKKYPNGLRGIANQLAQAGIALGLWFYPEYVTLNETVAREHPEWLLKPKLTTQNESATTEHPELLQKSDNRKFAYIRMDLPQVHEWFLSYLDKLVQKEGITCFRNDGFTYKEFLTDASENRRGIAEIENTVGVYKLWDEIRARYPNMLMEGCGAGGRRIDLETLPRFLWNQVADYLSDPEVNQCSLYGANLFLPGGYIMTALNRLDDYTAWSKYSGQVTFLKIPWNVKDYPTDLALKQVNRYKSIRPLLRGDFYPLTPCSLNQMWIGYQFHRADLDKGFAMVFRRTSDNYPLAGTYPSGMLQKSRMIFLTPDTRTFIVSFRGLESKNIYEVHLEKINKTEKLTGEELAKGISVVVNETPGAEMITYRRAQ